MAQNFSSMRDNEGDVDILCGLSTSYTISVVFPVYILT